ncbi:hypothetical protein [Deinococcus hohokamensis]|uniref:DUF3997 domain-containing protein n=1 Tax=Deinococcus hohokamensis TaxID=309883 RepID=A0ABV9IBR8_9DEIO
MQWLTVISTSLVLLLVGCDGIIAEPLAGKYVLITEYEDTHQYTIGVRAGGGHSLDVMWVSRIAHNDAFIIAKANDGYYIVRVAAEQILGPLSESAFQKKRIALRVPAVLRLKTLPSLDSSNSPENPY